MTSWYSTATFSISYVEFHWVLTLRRISHIWREWVAQALFHVGRTMVVERTMEKGSLWTYSSNGHECKGEETIETYKFTLFSIVQTASVLLINSPLSSLSKSASRSLYKSSWEKWLEEHLCQELYGVVETLYSVELLKGIGEPIKLICLLVVGCCIVTGES